MEVEAKILETNIAKTINIIVELLVVKKLPDVLSGKNSKRKIKKKGRTSLSKECKFNLNWRLFLTKILRNTINMKNKIILKPTSPRSVKISK